MKKLLVLLLVLGSLTGVAQKSIQNVGQVTNIYHVRGELQVDSLATFKWRIKTLKYKNNVAEDSMIIPDVNGLWKMIKIPTGAGGGVTTVFGRSGTVTAQTGDYSFAQISGHPNTLGGYGIGDAYPLSGNPANYLTSVPAQSFSSLTGKPTTRDGYGITDVYIKAQVDSLAALYKRLTQVEDITHGGTGQTSAAAALTALLPVQTGNAGKFLETDGTTATWQAPVGGGGTGVTGISVASANGFNGAATAGSTPIITIGTYITGLLKGNGAGVSAATAGVDYLAPNGSAAGLTSFPTLNQNTTGNAGTVTNGVYTTGSYSNPAWVTALAWAKITGAPAFLTANQSITLHSTGGDVAIASTTGTTDLNGVLTINNAAVSLAKIQNFAQSHIAYRASVGTGPLEDRTLAQLKTDLGLDQVTNTSDPNKALSNSEVSALGLKGNINDQAFTGLFVAPRTGNAVLQTDTIPQYTFGGGSAITGDTLWASTSAVLGNVYNAGTDSIATTSINFVVQGSSPTATVGVYYGTTLNSGGTLINSGGTVVTNTTVGQNVAVTAKIPPANYVWCKLTSVTTGSKPTYLGVTVTGYKIRK